MKTILRNADEVFHFWANQVQSEGRCGNVFFEGPSVFSYGYHFEIARIIKPGVVVFNSYRYSPTTGKHQSGARMAANHMKTYTVATLRWQGEINHNATVYYYLKNIEEGLYRLSRARTGYDWQMTQVKAAIRSLRDYVAQFAKDIDSKHRKLATAAIKQANNPLDKRLLPASKNAPSSIERRLKRHG